jgi:tetratricopeptide (TPR) repeat protein
VLQLVLSDALFATGDYHYAAHCLRRALELEPDLLEVEFDKRSFYGEVTDYDRHILLLERYLSDHILDDDARLLLGANYLFGGNPEGTVALFGDTFGEAIRNSNAGRLLLAAAERAIAAR